MEDLHPDSDLQKKFDEVSKTVRGVNDSVAAIAARTGVALKPGFDPMCPPGTAMSEKLVMMAARWAVAQETFSVERFEGAWGILYSRIPTPAMALLGEKPTRQPIADCSLDVKRSFLKHVVEFVQSYKEAVSGRLGEIDKDIGRGREAIDILSK